MIYTNMREYICFIIYARKISTTYRFGILEYHTKSISLRLFSLHDRLYFIDTFYLAAKPRAHAIGMQMSFQVSSSIMLMVDENNEAV